MLLHPIADRLHHLAPVAARDVDKAFYAQDIMRPDHRRKPVAERGRVGDRPATYDKALEIVVIMLAFEFVQGGPRGEIIFGGGGQAERDRRRHPALLGANQLDPRPQSRLDVMA